eukprot:SAG31_NODE_12277_length_953_cov_1.049180_1_plen_115_part_10
MAQVLGHAKELAEKEAEEPIKEAVITVRRTWSGARARNWACGCSSPRHSHVSAHVAQVPPFWSQDERQALINAAEMGGLKVLSLMNENTAVAMKYAIDRKFENTKEHNVIFYDMG